MTRIFLLEDPINGRYAEASRTGTWKKAPKRNYCSLCDEKEVRVHPLVIEWEPGSSLIGDFTWPGIGNDEIVVTDRVRHAVEEHCNGASFLPIEMSGRKKPKRSGHGPPRVWLPYLGPPLWELRPERDCKLDIQRTGVTVIHCKRCGAERYKFSGRSKRVVVARDSWDGEDVFRLLDLTYCTERFRDLCRSKRLSNVAFRLDGEIP